MTDIEATKPCVRGCTRRSMNEDEPPAPLLARHGNYCNRCYHATRNALQLTPALTVHILSMITVKGSSDDGSQRLKKQPPLPMNVAAFNDANELYSRLVYWSRIFADILHTTAPAPARRAWADTLGSIRGLPANINPADARAQTRLMANWMIDRLQTVCELPHSDDIDFFHDDMRDLYRVAARWPLEEKPRYSDMPCPDDACRGRIAVYPPRDVGDDQRIVCEKCHRWFLPEQYEHLLGVFQQIASEEKRAVRTTAHLMKKYLRAS